jgi:tetratricopeptide (TPR) repeat protein
MKKLLLLPPLAFVFSGCATNTARPDGDPLRLALKDAARGFVAGRSFDTALWALQHGDTARLRAATERLERSGAPKSAEWAQQIQIVTAEEAVRSAMTFDALASNSSGPGAKHSRAMAALRYRRALKIAPEFPSRDAQSLNALGYFLAEHGRNEADFKRAEEFTRRSLQLLDKKVADAELNRQNRSALLFERALTARDSWAWALYRLGRYDEALAAQKQAVAEAKDNYKAAGASEDNLAELYYHLGAIHAALNQKAEARIAFAETLRIDPKHQAAKEALAKL